MVLKSQTFTSTVQRYSLLFLIKINVELCHQFNEASSELLVRFSCLDPKKSFFGFDLEKVVRPGDIYDHDFSGIGCAMLRKQLQTYIVRARKCAAVFWYWIAVARRNGIGRPYRLLHGRPISLKNILEKKYRIDSLC
jgi:hypothetical protein